MGSPNRQLEGRFPMLGNFLIHILNFDVNFISPFAIVVLWALGFTAIKSLPSFGQKDIHLYFILSLIILVHLFRSDKFWLFSLMI